MAPPLARILATLAFPEPSPLDNPAQLREWLMWLEGAHGGEWLSHQFQPQGVSYCLLLAGAHGAVHTWPELGVCTVDLAHPHAAELFKRWFAACLAPAGAEICQLTSVGNRPPFQPATTAPAAQAASRLALGWAFGLHLR